VGSWDRGRLPARLARILTYAALACGAAFACLLLLSSPAQADDSGSGLSLLSDASSEDEGAVESVGRLLGDTARSAGDTTTDLVREAGAALPATQPVVDTTTGLVEHTTDAVATQVEHVTVEVDDQVGQLACATIVGTAAGRGSAGTWSCGRAAAG
jgi:hypothetical protein